MNKSWIVKPRNTSEYIEGLNAFLDFAFVNACVEDKIICPCPLCKFKKWQAREVVYEHLILKPFPKGYTFWFSHGEKNVVEPVVESPPRPYVMDDGSCRNDPIQDMIHDAFGYHPNDETMDEVGGTFSSSNQSMMNDETKEFYDLIKDGQQNLYEGCEKYSKLSFLVKLYHIKCLCGISDKAMSMILELLADAFESAKIPPSFYEAKKTINKLGLSYTKIHACTNDCMLYWGEDADRETCKKCNASRWKPQGKNAIGVGNKKKKKQPAKIEHGRKVSRGEVWIATHKRSDGSTVNDAASVIIDKITSHEASGSCSSQEVSQYDSLAMALGSQEHSGRVRGLGLGPTPSQVFGVRARGRSSDPTYTEMQNELTQLCRKVIENEEQTRLKDAKLERMQAFQTSLLQSLQGYLPSQVLQNLEALNEGISQSPPSCNQRDGQRPPDS